MRWFLQLRRTDTSSPAGCSSDVTVKRALLHEAAMEPAGRWDVPPWPGARGPKPPCRRGIVPALPSKRMTPGNGEGPPLPESHAELPPVIRRTELVAFSLAGLLL